MSFEQRLNDATSKQSAKEIKRRMKKVDKAFGKFDEALSGKKKSGGGGGGGRAEAMKKTRRGTRGGGGGGKKEQMPPTKKPANARSTAEEFVQNALNNTVDPKLDTRFEDERGDIRRALEESRGKLFQLSPEDQAKFAAQLEAEQALAERGFESQRDQMLLRLFGKGRTEGQLAGTMGGQLIEGQELVASQIRGADANRQLQAQFHLGEQNLQSLGLQSANLDSGRAGALQELSLGQQERMGNLSAATGITTTGMQTDAARDTASIAAAAQQAAARIGAAASVKVAGIHAAASRANAMAALDSAKYSTNAGLLTNIMGFEQADEHFTQDLGFRNRSLDVNAQLTREQIASAERMNKENQPSMFDKLLGAAAGGAASFFSGGFGRGG
jgi:hypothetical protein